MPRERMLEHAAAWIAAWNRKDIDTLMEHFAADAVFVSPRARELTGSATVSGSAAIRSYWLAAMARAERFDFRLDRALWDEQVRELVQHLGAPRTHPDAETGRQDHHRNSVTCHASERIPSRPPCELARTMP